MVSVSLIVIRVSDLERSKAFYELLGLAFIREKHGNGPIHYSAELSGVVFELYPESAANPVSISTRLGFSLAQSLICQDSVEAAGGRLLVLSGGSTMLVDPDGIKIDISYSEPA